MRFSVCELSRSTNLFENPKFCALDLFAGGGGAARGYKRAGFFVIGVDIRPQPRYAGDLFVRGDALNPPFDLSIFDLIHASPPCQHYTISQNARKRAHLHPDLIEPVRKMLQDSGRPYVIENVPGAPLLNPVKLCGTMFGLPLKRHRLFETSFPVQELPCGSHDIDYWVIHGHEARLRYADGPRKRANDIDGARKAMGCEWMNREELREAIPPAYTRYIGEQFLTTLS